MRKFISGEQAVDNAKQESYAHFPHSIQADFPTQPDEGKVLENIEIFSISRYSQALLLLLLSFLKDLIKVKAPPSPSNWTCKET